MRLWHQKLLSVLPRQQLLGQHRECCALRGNGWNRQHATVNYVFKYNPQRLIAYHLLVIAEMANRGYKVEQKWLDRYYRGKNCVLWEEADLEGNYDSCEMIYPEHDDKYLAECQENLQHKGIEICQLV